MPDLIRRIRAVVRAILIVIGVILVVLILLPIALLLGLALLLYLAWDQVLEQYFRLKYALPPLRR